MRTRYMLAHLHSWSYFKMALDVIESFTGE